MARLGCKVLGIDARDEHVEHARLIKEVHNMTSLEFKTRDFLDVKAGELGRFDVVLMFGLLYHIENPMGALRIARSHTRHVCLIETQIVPNLTGPIDWGSYRSVKEMVGVFGVVDETEELESGNREASVLNISLVPSLPALLFAMKAAGFARVDMVAVPSGGYNQLATGKRVMVAGYTTA
jgi:hypothetical protein